MFHAELIAMTSLDERFHAFAEQFTGVNSASVVQNNKRPRSELLYTLAYYKAFYDANSDTNSVKELFGMLHFTLLCGGHNAYMPEVTSFTHGLRSLSCPCNRDGVVGVLFAGDGEQWAAAIRNAGEGSVALQEWGRACHQQFAIHNLDHLIGRIRPIGESKYSLTT